MARYGPAAPHIRDARVGVALEDPEVGAPCAGAGTRLVRAWSNLQVERTSLVREAIADGGDEDDSGGRGDGTTRRGGRSQPPQARTSSHRPHAKRHEVESPRRRGNRRCSGGSHTTRKPLAPR